MSFQVYCLTSIEINFFPLIFKLYHRDVQLFRQNCLCAWSLKKQNCAIYFVHTSFKLLIFISHLSSAQNSDICVIRVVTIPKTT